MTGPNHKNDKPVQAKVSVKDLVAFSARTGDVRGQTGPGPTAAQGVAGHSQVRTNRPEPWQAEVTLAGHFHAHGVELALSGRADFVLQTNTGWLVEEIKTCLGPPLMVDPGTAALHWAQLKTYAYLLSLTQRLPAQETLQLQLTWFDIIRSVEHSEQCQHSVAELSAEISAVIDRYCEWLARVNVQKRVRNTSAAALPFPYPDYRPWQLELARQVYSSINQGQRLVVEAPTGSGKTISVLYPSCKAFGRIEQLIYLTAKNTTAAVALENLDLLRRTGLQALVVQLVAKQRACPCDLTGSEDCARCIGFFDRLPAAREQALACGWLDAERLHALADEFHLCPFELTLQMLPWADIVICDINYLFDPSIKLAVLEQPDHRRVLLIDELHNLPERVRAAFSAQVSLDDLDRLAQATPSAWPKRALNQLYKVARRELLNVLPQSSAQPSTGVSVDRLQPLATALSRLLDLISQYQVEHPNLTPELLPQSSLPEVIWPLRRAVFIAELAGQNHAAVVNSQAQTCQWLCLNATDFIDPVLANQQASIGFSGTLTPGQFFQANAALAEAKWIALPSHFPPTNQLTLLAPFVDTRYQARAASLQTLAELVVDIWRSVTSNVLVYMPSYSYLEQLREVLSGAVPSAQLRWQQRGDETAAQAALLAQLALPQAHCLGLVVLGGVFAEGIDLPAGALAAVVIVGTGMPQPSADTRLVQQYWADKGEPGFDFAYRAPGFVRVLQAAGRVVRSARDRGIVVLIDPRYPRSDYLSWFPAHWRPQTVHNATHLGKLLQDFETQGAKE